MSERQGSIRLAQKGRRKIPVRSWTLLIVLWLFLYSWAAAQEAAPVVRGTWTATVGPSQVLRGQWAAPLSRDTPNVATGSWTLLNEVGQQVMEGTWSARKSAQGWLGTWTAQTLDGQSRSGTWKAILPGFTAKTLREMLESTVQKEAAGSWRSSSYQGNWWLKGSPAETR
jgi:hypothetical protein